jgi:hypothetical protein
MRHIGLTTSQREIKTAFPKMTGAGDLSSKDLGWRRRKAAERVALEVTRIRRAATRTLPCNDHAGKPRQRVHHVERHEFAAVMRVFGDTSAWCDTSALSLLAETSANARYMTDGMTPAEAEVFHGDDKGAGANEWDAPSSDTEPDTPVIRVPDFPGRAAEWIVEGGVVTVLME